MINRCHFDPVHSRWIDEWIPVEEPEKALAQAIRCYTPADFLLLLERTCLAVQHIEVDGQALDIRSNAIAVSHPLLNAWCYLVHKSGSRLRWSSSPPKVPVFFRERAYTCTHRRCGVETKRDLHLLSTALSDVQRRTWRFQVAGIFDVTCILLYNNFRLIHFDPSIHFETGGCLQRSPEGK
jgi:hypothetical protein